MDLDSAKIADLRVKHLEMLQAVISRIAGQGATLKNYCITLTTAVCGFAITLEKPLVTLLALCPVTIFALLDVQYLRMERRFRVLGTSNNDDLVVGSTAVAARRSFSLLIWRGCVSAFCGRRPVQGASGEPRHYAAAIRSSVTSRR